MDIARGGELVEAELERFIATRSRKEPDADEHEELWKESVRRYNARRREENRLAWAEYHQAQAARHRAVLEAMIREHEEQAERYLPKGAA